MRNLVAIVVSYGGSVRLDRLLSDLVNVVGCQVILMENNSAATHENRPAGVRVQSGHGNVGYGTAVNLAVRHLLDHDTSPIWLLVANNDIALPRGTAEMLPKLLDEAPEDADVMGFAFQTEQGQPDGGSGMLPSRRMNAYRVIRGETATMTRWPELRYPSGAFFAIRTETFLRLGGFDTSYWMYYEETDLFARLREIGGQITWADASWPVVHDGGATAGRAPLLHIELGRSAAIYARRHRNDVGCGWLAVVACQLTLLAAHNLAMGRLAEAIRAGRILIGLAGGVARSRWEPGPQSRWRAVPADARARVGWLPQVAGKAATIPG